MVLKDSYTVEFLSDEDFDFQTRREWAKLESRILVDGPRSSGDLHTCDFNLPLTPLRKSVMGEK